MNIIAFDLATRGGWATGSTASAEYANIRTGYLDLEALAVARFAVPKSRLTHGHLYAVLESALDELFASAPDLVAYEEQTYRGKGARLLQGLRALVECRTARLGAQWLLLNAGQARLLALGDGGLDKEDAQALARAIQLPGADAATEDERDAAILLEAARVHVQQRSLPPVPKKRRRK